MLRLVCVLIGSLSYLALSSAVRFTFVLGTEQSVQVLDTQLCIQVYTRT
jgi:hypothetical protein